MRRCTPRLFPLVLLVLLAATVSSNVPSQSAEPGQPRPSSHLEASASTTSTNGSTSIEYVGSLLFSENSILNMQIGGPLPGSGYDQLVTSGTIYADGTLQVDLINAYQPLLGDAFDLFEGDLAGEFDTVAVPTLGSGQSWDMSALYSSGTLAVVPEPSTVAALVSMAALGMMLVWRRTRRRVPPPAADASGPETWFEE